MGRGAGKGLARVVGVRVSGLVRTALFWGEWAAKLPFLYYYFIDYKSIDFEGDQSSRVNDEDFKIVGKSGSRFYQPKYMKKV